jgi:hypothetical protein
MKKIISIAVFITSLMFVISCATNSVTGSGLKGSKPKIRTAKTAIIDYQGAELGVEIPEWVVLVSSGEYSNKTLSKAMPDLDGRKLFVAMGRGDNLEFVKQWTELVQIEVNVGDTLQRVVGKAVSASMTGSSSEEGKKADPTEVNRKIDMYKEAVSTVEVNGLEEVASFWTESASTDKKNPIDYFSYYTVWAMDEDKYDKQIDAAMKNVKDNSSEGEMLKKTLSAKLKNLVLATSNDGSILSAADNEVIEAK